VALHLSVLKSGILECNIKRHPETWEASNTSCTVVVLVVALWAAE